MSATNFLSNFFDENNRPKKIPESKNTIHHDKWDKEDYEAILNEMKGLSIAEDRLTNAVGTGASAMADTFYAFMKANPKLKDSKDVRPSYLVNRTVEEQFMELKEYEEVRVSSCSDVVASGLSCIAMEPDLEILFDKLEQETKMAEELEQLLSEMEGLSDSLDDLEGMAAAAAGNGQPGEAQDYQEQAERIKEQLEKMREQAQQQAQDLDHNLEKQIPVMKEAGRNALKEAKNKAEEMDSLSSTWGIDPGQLSKMPAERRIELATKFNNERFKRISQLLGAMKRLAMAEQKLKVDYAREEIYDMELGNDLSVTLPIELLAAGDDDGWLLFAKKYAEAELVQYKLRGTDKVAQGGIIWCEDGSGSMYGEPEIWAKAVGLALCQIARLQKRDFYAVHFGSAGEYQTFDFNTVDNSGVDIALRGNPWMQDENVTGHYDNVTGVIKFAETFFNGGTDFVTPLSVALDRLRAEYDANGAVKGDIVFCTDGICGVPQDWLKAFKEEQERLGFRVWGILLGYAPNKESEPLNTICDGRIFVLQELLDGSGIKDVFRNV